MKKKIFTLLLLLTLLSQSAWTSPWAKGETYGDKVGGKAVFGMKNLFLGWTALFTEPVKYNYFLEKKEGWEGLCYGISKAVLYTATGAIQLVTFPIPLDLPNIGEGVLETSMKDQAAREQGKKVTPTSPITAENSEVKVSEATTARD